MKPAPRQVLFVQGGGDGAHDRWDDKLVDSLRRELGSACAIRYPRMPDEADPNYQAWKAALKKEFAKLGEGTVLVGHSIGGTILINVLAEEPPGWKASGVFLVSAPFVGKGGWPSEEIPPVSDIGKRLPRHLPIYLYQGSEDETVPSAHLKLYESAIPHAVVRRLAGRNHQLNDDLSEVAADIRRRIAGV